MSLRPEWFYDKDRLLARLKALTRITEDGHWLWIGKTTIHGRGVMLVGGVKGKDIEVHRVSAYVHHNLNLKDSNSHALHKPTCPHKNCWNPSCLYVGSHQDNMRDIRTVNTMCINGHSYQLYQGWKRNWMGKYDRYCRECQRLRTRKARAGKREKTQKENQS